MNYLSQKMLAIFQFAGMTKPVSLSRISDRDRPRRSPSFTGTVAQNHDLEGTSVSLKVTSLGETEGRRNAPKSDASENTNRFKDPATSSAAQYETNVNAQAAYTSASFPPDADSRAENPKSKRPILVLAIADAPKPDLCNLHPNTNTTAPGSDSDSDSDAGLNQLQIPGLPVVLTLSPATPIDEIIENPYLPENYPYGYERHEDGDFEYRPYVDVTRLFGTWNMDEAMLGNSDDQIDFGESDAEVDVNDHESDGQTESRTSEAETRPVSEVAGKTSV